MINFLSFQYGKHRVRYGNAIYLLFAVAVLTICCLTATRIQMSQCPDEAARYLLPQFIFRHGQLPFGWEPEVRIENWGFSYAFMPYLPAIISAFFMRVASVLGAGDHGLLVAARLVSALSVAGAAFVACKLGEKVTGSQRAGLLCGIAVGCTPQVIFVGSYVNNDAMALLSVIMMVYAWALGCLDDGISGINGPSTAWSPKILALMSVGMVLALLSYYNSYGFVLLSPIVFVIHARRRNCSWARIIRGLMLVAIIVFLLAGWHFIRSAILYQGDIFGMRMRREFMERYSIDAYKSAVLSPRAKGWTPWETFVSRGWFVSTAISFLCETGYMDVPAPLWVYAIYTIAVVIGITGCLSGWRSSHHEQAQRMIPAEMLWGLTCACTITIALSMWYTYATDFQAQGRYIFGCMPAYALILACGLNHFSRRLQPNRTDSAIGCLIDPCLLMSLVLITLLVACYLDCLIPCFLPRP